MVGAVLFFGIFTPIGLMAANGSIARIITNGQNQRTVRIIRQPQRVRVADPIQLPHTQSAPPLALPGGSTYVPAQAEPDDSAKREAAAWLLQLYDGSGNPDPKKVLMQSNKERPGRIRIGAPSTPAKQYLLDRGVIHELGNGYRLAIARYPTINHVHDQLV
jgi:hypothetical protein